ncbi:hypothetical protein Poli38472_004164 [Pythium oligandrum]|uniref:tRNA-uridine aminocarboxypropyltransferase 1 n=1 Tax=Pythium oligandrum TaxID=41045 RepID=A0A8K1CMU4_PYTOL|nr:hypothetical protein Poli38472_004164 [Pythium oligandrum]|eukprot:TMW66399.1 hypothetical protein Poli38472_004164 [Pythium oligandrum]
MATDVSTEWTRALCATCEHNYKFYCPKCCVPVGVPENATVPSLVLPLQVHIWFQDKLKKSTAPHAKVLAPQDVEIVNYPLDDDRQKELQYDRESVVVVYPTNYSETMPEMTPTDLAKVKTLVFIDCPWQKAPVILQDPKLENLRCVKLAVPPSESKFWRYHQAGAGCVSTIEAIQLMLEDYTKAMKQAGLPLRAGSEDTDVSELLFFFHLLYSHIADRYEKDPKQLRKPPMDENEKERQRQLRNQKESGRKRKLVNKQEAWESVQAALERGEITEVPKNGRCYNCKQPGHEAKDCPNPCRYCKEAGHFSGDCSMKRVRQELTAQQQTRITQA